VCFINFREKMVLYISVEGNIGAGKSETLKVIRNLRPEYRIELEKIEEWNDVGGKSMLNLLYENMHRWTFAFQIMIAQDYYKKYLERMKEEEEGENYNKVILSERCVDASRFVFTKNAVNTKILTQTEYMILEKMFENNKEKHTVDCIIYLKCNPLVLKSRVNKRGRKCEEGVSVEYLSRLNDFYDAWLLNNKNCVVIDVNEMNIQDVVNRMLEIIDEKIFCKKNNVLK